MRFLAAFLAPSLVLAACNYNYKDHVCAGVGYYAVHATIRDMRGEARALSATMVLHDGAYVEPHVTSRDTLDMWGAEERGGHTYDVQVSAPFYEDTWVRGVRTPYSDCPTNANIASLVVDVPVRLSLAPGAPPVRSVHVLPPEATLDRPPYTTTLTMRTFVDADPGLSRAVTWGISGDTAWVTFDSTAGVLHYRCHDKSGYVTVTARSVMDSTVLGTARIGVQGHPGATNDPPCS